MSEEIDVLLKIGSKFYEGKLKPQTVGKPAEIPQTNAPMFPEPYSELLSVKEEATEWIVRPREFLRREDFAEIARIVRSYKGQYMSAGKSSYFKIPK